ncbi:MAG: sigma-54 dependent transcriptional regulator [Geothermobacteraceae bacterium]
MRTILVVDDEASIRESLQGILQDEGYNPVFAEDGEQALAFLNRELPDLVLLDIWMPGMDGLEVLERIKALYPDLTVIMMSGHGTIETAVRATKMGAFDFIEKPLSLEKMLLAIQNGLKVVDLAEENRNLRQQLGKDVEIIGTSAAIQELKRQIDVAAPTSGWVLITGENGTGKELVARSIHAKSKRAKGPFVEVNCAAIPEELIESELFGHEKGAFTGATSARRGKFDQANGGTLFLDEIGDMSLKTQAKILRILQERKFERVGGNRTIEVDVRVVAATNKNLEAEIEAGNFREDLYYRLNVLPFHVPPLRERREDIPMLADHFLRYFCSQESRDSKSLDRDALEALMNYNWPGNVRELKNIIERLVIMVADPVITRAHLPSGIVRARDEGHKSVLASLDGDASFRTAREEFEKEFLLRKLQEYDWNISRTAVAIEMERSNLHKKIKAYGIELRK